MVLLAISSAGRYDFIVLKVLQVWRLAMAPRIILRIELTPTAKEQLENVSDRLGMTQVAMLSRVIEWFARQPEALQRMIVGHMPREIQKDVARLLLRQFARDKKTSATSTSRAAALEQDEAT